MFTPRKFGLLILSAALALAAGLAFTGPVYAQEGAPQPTVPAGDETLPPPPMPSDSLDGLSAGSDPAAPPPPPPPDLSTITSGLAATGVVLVDEEDHPLPVISQAIPEGNFPWIRVGTTIHYFATDCTGLTSECHPYANPVQGAVDYIVEKGILPTDRAIHVDSSVAPYTGTVSIDGVLHAILKQLNRLDGGCSHGTGLCDSSDPTKTIIDGGLSVKGTLAGFTLQGLTFKGGVTFAGNTGALVIRNVAVDGASNSGLDVRNHSGAITLEGVRVTGSTTTGISIDNSAVIAPVSITSGESSHAGGLAGEIITKGPVTITASSFHHGGAGGLKITTAAYLTVRNGLFTDNSFSSSTNPWDGAGLYAIASSITLDEVQSIHNGRDGFMLNANGAIALVRSRAMQNGRDGLRICKDGDCSNTIVSAGVVALTGAEFSNNTGNGALLSYIGALTATRATFNGNILSGLNVISSNPVSLNGILANDNQAFGVRMDLCQFDSSLGSCTASASFTMLNTAGQNQVAGNSYDGLWVRSGGVIHLTGLEALANKSSGIILINRESKAAPGVKLYDLISNENFMRGMLIQTRGPVFWNKGGASRNGNLTTPVGGYGGGVYIDNSYGTAPVSLTRLEFNDNLVDNGLNVLSKGAITLAWVNAGGNGWSGVYLDNAETGAAGGISITFSPDSQGLFNGNGANGLEIRSKGAILLSWLEASGNGQSGALIDNTGASAYAPVTLMMINSHVNGSGGVKVTSRGAITIINIDALNNNGIGVWLENTAGAGAVTIRRTLQGQNVFNNNKGIGLRILARGQVTLDRIAASNVQPSLAFEGIGAWVDNCLWNDPDGNGPMMGKCFGAGGVTLNATPGWDNDFHNNATKGLWVESGGAINAINLQAILNGQEGVLLDNSRQSLPFSVTVASIGDSILGFIQNGRSGLVVYSSGALMIRNVRANGNDGHGAWLDNTRALTPRPVNVINSVFNNNRNGDGLHVYSKGPVTLVDIEAQNNDAHEMVLPPETSTFNRLQMTGYEHADVFQISNVTNYHLFNLEPDFNATLRLESRAIGGSSWTLVDEMTGDSIMNLGGTLADGYEYRVLVIGNDLSNGNTYRLTDSGDMHYVSIGAGVHVTTDFESASGLVRLINMSPNSGHFSGNASDGIHIHARGAIHLSRVVAENNGGHGALVDNCVWNFSLVSCTITDNVSLSGVSNGFNGNRRTGLLVSSFGAISVDNINAWGNGGKGVYLTNAYGVSGVTVKSSNPNGANRILQNGNIGLTVFSSGAILIEDTEVIGNVSGGGLLDNTYGNRGITIRASRFNLSTSNLYGKGLGLEIDTKGAVFLDGVHANGNESFGANISNTTSLAPQPVTILRSEFNHTRNETGLVVESQGFILLNNVEASHNYKYGAVLNNCLLDMDHNPCTYSAPVSVLGTLGENTFNGNGNAGLQITSDGNLTISRIVAGFNGKSHASEPYGAIIVSYHGSIIVNDGLFERNWGSGLVAFAERGSVTVIGIRCYSNALDSIATPSNTAGAAISSFSTKNDLRVINSIFTGNGDYGLMYHTFARFIWIGSIAVGNNYENNGAKDIYAY